MLTIYLGVCIYYKGIHVISNFVGVTSAYYLGRICD